MNCVMYLYRWNSRNLKKIIISILKSWVASAIQRINYVKNYRLNGKEIEKDEAKLILICTDNEDKLDSFLSKNWVQIEKIKCN